MFAGASPAPKVVRRWFQRVTSCLARLGPATAGCGAPVSSAPCNAAVTTRAGVGRCCCQPRWGDCSSSGATSWHKSTYGGQLQLKRNRLPQLRLVRCTTSLATICAAVLCRTLGQHRGHGTLPRPKLLRHAGTQPGKTSSGANFPPSPAHFTQRIRLNRV